MKTEYSYQLITLDSLRIIFGTKLVLIKLKVPVLVKNPHLGSKPNVLSKYFSIKQIIIKLKLCCLKQYLLVYWFYKFKPFSFGGEHTRQIHNNGLHFKSTLLFLSKIILINCIHQCEFYVKLIHFKILTINIPVNIKHYPNR